MGYYTGSGVVVGGGSSANLRSTGPAIGGAYYVYQRTNRKTTEKNGVSINVAMMSQSDANMSYWQWPGGMIEPGAKGSRRSVSFSQINGSNLYKLSITEDVIQVRGVQGSYDSGWVS